MSEAPKGRSSVAQGVVARPWLLVFLPVNAAASGFSVALPLLILFTLHGNILEVALASTLYSIAIVPASLFWGVVCDRLGVRSPLLLLNYIAFAAVFLALATWPSLLTLLIVYTAFGVIAPSSAAASNLLILERFPASERPTAFASFSELSMIGNVLGILVGLLWVLRFPGADGLLGILYLSAGASLASALGVALFVRDAPVLHRRAHLAHHPESLVARLRLHIPYFPHPPGRGSLHRAARWLREEATHEVPLMLVGGFLFGLGSNLFNTSYTPYLASVGIASAGIFLVNLSNNAFQAVVLPFTGRACEGGRSGPIVLTSTWARVAAYGSVFGLALVAALGWGPTLGGGTLLSINLVAFGLIGTTFAFYSTSSSLLLFRSLEGRNAGSLLGANSALGGLAAVLGAAASGVLSHAFGYHATFLVASLSIASAVPAWGLALRAFDRRRRGVSVAAPQRVSPGASSAA